MLAEREGKVKLNSRIRVLVAKIGLDGHDRGARVVATALREAGMEVIYTGPWQTIEQITKTALQEDVDVIGISSLSYDHVLVPKLMDTLKQHNAEDIIVLVGGIVPDEDVHKLQQCGVKGIFHPGTKLEKIVSFINNAALERRNKQKGE